MPALSRSWLALAVVVAACTPKDRTPPKATYQGEVVAALAGIAKDCVPYGIAEGQPLEKASDLRCTSPDAEMRLHLDKWRRVRSVQIHMLAASTEEARARLDKALLPLIDDHHRNNVLAHLDDPVPGGMSPIPQLALEGYLYQVASEPLPDDTRRRYVFKMRVD